MKYTIRQANEKDAKSLIQLLKELQSFNYELNIKTGVPQEIAEVNLLKQNAYKLNEFSKWLKDLNDEKKQMVYLAVYEKTKKDSRIYYWRNTHS